MKTEKKNMFGITDEEYYGLTLKERWKIAIRCPAYIMCMASVIAFIIFLGLI